MYLATVPSKEFLRRNINTGLALKIRVKTVRKATRAMRAANQTRPTLQQRRVIKKCMYTKGGAAPEEQASDTSVARRVAFEDKMDVGMAALASDAAGLVNGFITQDQHNTTLCGFT